MLIIKVGKGFLSLWFSQEKSALQVNYPQQKISKFFFGFCIYDFFVKCTEPKRLDFLLILSWFQDWNTDHKEFLCVRTRFCWQTTFWSLLHFQSFFRLFLVAVSSVSELLQSCLRNRDRVYYYLRKRFSFVNNSRFRIWKKW